jgi:acetyltransferase AlgX (SGNH hydrolase-like protein)
MLHPLTLYFGRDGSLIVLGVHFLLVLAWRTRVRAEWKLLATATFAGLLIVETILSAIGEPGRKPPKGRVDYGDVMGDYREGGFLKPNLDMRVVGGEGDVVRFITESHGFRNRSEARVPKPEGLFRVILVGDSFVAGYRTDQGSTVGAVLEDELRRRAGGRDVEVLSAGAGHPGAYKLWVERHAFRFEPDVLLIGITLGNDISQAWLAWRGLSGHVNDDLFLPPDAYREGVGALEVKLDRSLRGWRLYRRLATALRPDVIASWYDDAPGYVHLFDALHSLGHFYALRPLPLVEESYDALFADLNDIAALCRTRGVPVVMVLFPQRFQVNQTEWPATLFRYGLEPAVFENERPNRRILAGCESAGIDCLDLLPPFRNACAAGCYLPRGDMHWNTRGHAVAARALAEALAARGLDGANLTAPSPVR